MFMDVNSNQTRRRFLRKTKGTFFGESSNWVIFSPVTSPPPSLSQGRDLVFVSRRWSTVTFVRRHVLGSLPTDTWTYDWILDIRRRNWG